MKIELVGEWWKGSGAVSTEAGAAAALVRYVKVDGERIDCDVSSLFVNTDGFIVLDLRGVRAEDHARFDESQYLMGTTAHKLLLPVTSLEFVHDPGSRQQDAA